VSIAGTRPISRAAARDPQMPAAQGYIATGGDQFRPNPASFAPGRRQPPASGANLNGIGIPWAPGQGGDTPGGGGAGEIGNTVAVDVSSWYNDGFVTPFNASHAPGSVGAKSRRGNAGQRWPGTRSS
jgi:hypothetical protein